MKSRIGTRKESRASVYLRYQAPAGNIRPPGVLQIWKLMGPVCIGVPAAIPNLHSGVVPIVIVTSPPSRSTARDAPIGVPLEDWSPLSTRIVPQQVRVILS